MPDARDDLLRADALAGLDDVMGRSALVADATSGVHARRLAQLGARVTLLDPDEPRAQRMRRELGVRAVSSTADLGERRFDLVVVAEPASHEEGGSALPGGVRPATVRDLAGRVAYGGRMVVCFDAPRAPLRHGRALRRVRRAMHKAGLPEVRTARFLPGRVGPRFLLLESSGSGAALGMLAREVLDFGQRRPELSRFESLLGTKASRRSAQRLLHSVALTGRREDAPAGDAGDALVLCGREFGGVAVVARLGPDGALERVDKVARHGAARDALQAEQERLDWARRIFEPHVRVPHATLAEGRLELEPLPGRRLAALLSGHRRPEGIAVATDLARGLGAVVAKTRRDVPVEAAVFDPALRSSPLPALREAGVELPAAFTVAAAHGDLQPVNAIGAGDGTAGLVDWECGKSGVAAWFDILFLLTEMTGWMRPEPEPAEGLPIAAELVPVLDAFRDASGLSEDSLRAYLPLFAVCRELRAEHFSPAARAAAA